LANTTKLPLIIGHRGASASAPENTLSAFKSAFDDGAGGIELDVRLSRDGVPVVIHDATLPGKRLRKRLISRLTSAQLKQIDVGSRFNQHHPDLARAEYTGQTIPTLDEVFQLVADMAAEPFVIYVELKCGPSRKRNEELARETVAAVQRYDLKEQAILISFNLRTVATIKQIDNSLRTGALFGPRRAVRSPATIVRAAVNSAADEILLNHRIASQKLIDAAGAKNLPVVIWTVDDVRWTLRAQSLEIHALITNNPAKFLKVSTTE